MAAPNRKVTPLTFLRVDGDWSESGQWVEYGSPVSVVALGNLQPYRMGTSQLTLPEGFKAQDALIYYTETPINTVDQFTKALADRTTIDNRTYIAQNSENWSRYVSNNNHYKVLLVRDDLPSNGGL